MANRCHTINGTSTKKLKPKKFNGTSWVDCPTYRFTSSSSVDRMDQQLVTKTKVIEGYPQWNGSFRRASATGVGDYDEANLYQGKYPSGYKEYKTGVMCFTNLFNQARSAGTITKVELRLKNNHAYYNTGLKTRIQGVSSLPTSRPSTLDYGLFGSTVFSSDVSFAKNGASPIWITLNSNGINAIKNNQINGLRVVSPTGWDLANYGYFEGSNDNRPYIKITVEYQVWE